MNDGIEVFLMLDKPIRGNQYTACTNWWKQNNKITYKAYISPVSSEMYVCAISMAPEPCVLTDTCALVDVLWNSFMYIA